MTANDVKRIYVEGLRILFSAENQLNKSLARMARAATALEVRLCLTGRMERAKEHLVHLETVLASIKERPEGGRCRYTERLIAEGLQIMKKHFAPEQLDGELITIAQRIERQEIAGYSWVCAQARILKEDTAALLLEGILEEEKITADKLARFSCLSNTERNGPDRTSGVRSQWKQAASGH